MSQYGSGTQLALIDKRTLPCTVVGADLLAQRLEHIGESAQHKLLQRLVQFTPDQLDFASICEKPSGVGKAAACVQEMYKQVAIFASSGSGLAHGSIQFEGEELFPCEMLPDDGGVEFRSGYTSEYRAITEEDRLVQAALSDSIAHCEKLLHDLPIALNNSQTAMEAHTEVEEVDLNTLGAMVMEQKRIRKEIANQGVKLVQLEKEEQLALSHIASQRRLFKHQTVVKVPFGEVQADERTYILRKVAPPTNKAAVLRQAETIVSQSE